MRLALRTRFALLAAGLVLLVASLVGLAAYLSFRASLLSRADRSAQTEAHRLVGLVAGGGGGSGGNGQAVDLTDSSLTRQLATPGMHVAVIAASGRLVQASPGTDAAALASPSLWRACLIRGQVRVRVARPAASVACERVGPGEAPHGAIVVGVPLASSLASLATLARTLILGVLAGGLLAALLSLLLARRALRPVRRIAQTAETIREGDLGRRIGYRGRDELGELAAVLDACFDELERSVERQRRFAADASHELKTPLAAIRANVELLGSWAGADEAARTAALQSLDQSSRRALRLVSDLLELVRQEREPVRPRVPVRLDEVVVAAVREATPLRESVPIRILRLDDVTVPGDPLGIQQVLVNVLDNALEVSPPGGEVTVELSDSGERACVKVSDCGLGVGPAERERIFDPFYSNKPAGASRTGAGLGLAIARSIARAHGGELTVRGASGGGATFELALPLVADGRRPSPPSVLRPIASGNRDRSGPTLAACQQRSSPEPPAVWDSRSRGSSRADTGP